MRMLGWILVVLMAFFGVAARAEERVAPIAAVICEVGTDKPAGAMAALLEARLGDLHAVKLVDRAAIKAVLGEQKLSLMLSPEGGKQRIAAGQQLRASLLILIRPVDDKPNQLSLVVSETGRGLRLMSRTITIEGDAEKAAGALAQLVKEAAERGASPITDIVAVPPFVNDDLTHGSDTMKRAYATLVEQAAEADAGVVVVELAEARAIAQEITTAAGTDRVERALPIYVMGRFRSEAGEKGVPQRTRLTLEIRRGETGGASLKSEPLAPDAVAEYLRKNVSDSLKGLLGRDIKAQGADLEAAPLRSRADLFIRVGDRGEALNLLHSAMLLVPADMKLRHRAVSLGTELINAIWSKESGHPINHRPMPGTGSRVKGAAPQAEMAAIWVGLVPSVEYIIREDVFARPGASPLLRKDQYTQLIGGFEDVNPVGEARMHAMVPCPAEYHEGHRQIREAIIAGLEQRRYKNEERAWQPEFAIEQLWVDGGFYGESDAQTLAEIVRAFRATPDPEAVPIPTVSSSRGWAGMKKYHFVLEDVNRIQKALEEAGVRRHNAERNAFTEQSGVMDELYEKESVRTRNDKSDMDEHPELEDKSMFKTTKVDLVDPETSRKVVVTSWIAVEDTFDIVVGAEAVYKLTRPLNLTRLYRLRAGSQPQTIDYVERPVRGLQRPIYDGKYVWAVFPGTPQMAVAIEPVSGKVIEFAEKEGLPGTMMGVMVAPIGPGKACVIGAMGDNLLNMRTWFAVLEVKADGGKSLEVIAQAKSQDTKSALADMAFVPLDATLVAVGDPKNEETHRICVRRHRGGIVLVDFAKRTLECPKSSPRQNGRFFPPAMYPVTGDLLWNESNEATSYVRMQFPDPKPVATWARIPDVLLYGPIRTPMGWLIPEWGNRERGKQLWFARDFDDTLRPVGRALSSFSRSLYSNVLGLVDYEATFGVYQIEIDPKQLLEAASKPAAVTKPIAAAPTAGKMTTLPDGRRQYVNPIGITFVEVPAGKFVMGSRAGETGRAATEIQRTVEFSKPFFIATTEFTRAQYRTTLDPKLETHFTHEGPDLPVTRLSAWYIDHDVAPKLNKLDGNRYRLPSEAEWEYACRAGSATAYSFGDNVDELGAYATFSPAGKWGETNGPSPVASHKPNAWGIYDMHGNVMELCTDQVRARPKFFLGFDAPSFPRGSDEELPWIIRGGSWADEPAALRSAQRRWRYDNHLTNMIGVRFVMQLGDSPKQDAAKVDAAPSDAKRPPTVGAPTLEVGK